MDEPDVTSYPSADPLVEPMLTSLTEVCRSYQTFLRDFAKRKRDRDIDEHPIALWLLYLLALSYDVGFIGLECLRDGLDRQLLTMKRQAFEYAVKAQYLVRYPEKALQQYQSIPLKQKEFLKRLGLTEANSEAARLLREEEERLRGTLPDIQPTYGEVAMFDMLRALDPESFSERYARHHWLPSATMHGFQLGMLDVLRRLPDGKLWISNHSMLSTRNENVAVLTDSLIRVLLLTGNQFGLYGTHWVAMTARFNRSVTALIPNAGILDIGIDTSGIFAAAQQYVPAPCSVPHPQQKLRIAIKDSNDNSHQVSSAEAEVLFSQLLGAPTEAIAELANFADEVMRKVLLRKLAEPDILGERALGLSYLQVLHLAIATGGIPRDLQIPLEKLFALREESACDATSAPEAVAIEAFVAALPGNLISDESREGKTISEQLRFGGALLAMELMRCLHSRLERSTFFKDLTGQVFCEYRRITAEDKE